MPPLPPPYNLLDYVLKRVAEEDVKPLMALIQAEYAAHVAHIEDEDNQDSSSSSEQEQSDANSDDLTELGSEVSEEDGLEEDGSEEDGSESSFMPDSVDSSESEV